MSVYMCVCVCSSFASLFAYALVIVWDSAQGSFPSSRMASHRIAPFGLARFSQQATVDWFHGFISSRIMTKMGRHVMRALCLFYFAARIFMPRSHKTGAQTACQPAFPWGADNHSSSNP